MKITKGHFNRKILFFGVLAFLAISLISTGFASWIMSTGAELENKGGVTVGTITDGSLHFTEIVFADGNNNIIFDAKATDTTGDIKASLAEGSAYENLSVTFTTTLSPVEYLDDLTIIISIPENVKNAADAGYITLPSCCYVDGTVAAPVVLVDNGEIQTLGATEDNTTGIVCTITEDPTGTYNITCTINFGWGSEFGYENPGVYLDEYSDSETGLGLDFATKRSIMIDFKRVIYGLNVEPADETSKVEGVEYKTEDEILAHIETLEFNVKLIATSN